MTKQATAKEVLDWIKNTDKKATAQLDSVGVARLLALVKEANLAPPPSTLSEFSGAYWQVRTAILLGIIEALEGDDKRLGNLTYILFDGKEKGNE